VVERKSMNEPVNPEVGESVKVRRGRVEGNTDDQVRVHDQYPVSLRMEDALPATAINTYHGASISVVVDHGYFTKN